MHAYNLYTYIYKYLKSKRKENENKKSSEFCKQSRKLYIFSKQFYTSAIEKEIYIYTYVYINLHASCKM